MVMTVLEGIAITGSLNNFCRCIDQASQWRMRAISNKFPTYQENQFYRFMTTGYYILNLSEWKTVQKHKLPPVKPRGTYKPRAIPPLTQQERNKIHCLKKLAKLGYYSPEDCGYILKSTKREVMLLDIWHKTKLGGKLI